MSDCLPNFFIVGAAKSGTTSLHEYLAQHPSIYMSFPKELNFFSFFGSIPNFGGPPADPANPVLCERLQREKYALSITTWQDYRRVFSRVGCEKGIGESSVSYLYFPQAAERIRQWIPSARLIAVLRNPVDRAYSKYHQLRRDNAEPLIRFEEALTAETTRMRQNWSPAWFYVDRGFYHRQLKRYYDLFDRSQIHVVLYEDFMIEQTAMMERIFSFLDVDTGFRPDISQKYNVSNEKRVPRNRYIYDLVARTNWASAVVRDLLPARSLRYMGSIAKRVVTRVESGVHVAPMARETREMLKRIFAGDIHKLQDLIGKDLSLWL